MTARTTASVERCRDQGRTRRQLLAAAAASCLLVASFAIFTSAWTTQATPTDGVNKATLASGDMPLEVAAAFGAHSAGHGATTTVGRLRIIRFDVQPGYAIGWRHDAGLDWIIVVEGTLTYFSASDRGCHGVRYPAGSALLATGNQPYNARNESTETLGFYVVKMLPENTVAETNMQHQGICPF